ncbi:hypothetical protein BASA60_002081 [Batrachochytrium salamandrivorans]|nr:hypothetical protein BASA60_002081 [Batrachochytrium salamandrivorans]
MTTVGSKNATFRITLGPKQYIQPDDNGYYSMIIKPGGDLNAILGVPFFTNLNVVLDRDQGRVGFSLGCGCDTATDSYPTIQNALGVSWSSGQSASNPSYPTKTSTSIPTPTPTLSTEDCPYFPTSTPKTTASETSLSTPTAGVGNSAQFHAKKPNIKMLLCLVAFAGIYLLI